MTPARALVPVLLALGLPGLASQADPIAIQERRDTRAWTINGAQVADGSGVPLQRVDVRIEGDTIREIGSLTPRADDRSIDATGLVLAPGFIDAHNHSTEGLDGDPEATTQVSQGITTVLLGQDGSSPFPVRDYLARRRAAPTTLNVALLVGHATIRRQVMGENFRRPATRAEIARMETLVDQEMRDGAIRFVNGTPVWAGDRPAGNRAGHVLSR